MIARKEDEPALVAYFDASPDETIWLRIAWSENDRLAFERDAQGRIVGMAAHCANGVIQVHGKPAIAIEARRPLSRVAAVAGPPDVMKAAIDALGFSDRPVAQLSREILMSVETDKLVLPEILSQPDVRSRRATKDDLPLLIEWRKRYFQEVHSTDPGESLLKEVSEHQEKGWLWVLEVGGQIVNTADFSAVFPHLVQIEYAWGPPELRAKKYGRSTVAGALAIVKPEGIRRAVFNTDENNLAVQNAIAPVGFRKTGDHHVTLFGS
jgi:predicted GNAT family acetyltransferase